MTTFANGSILTDRFDETNAMLILVCIQLAITAAYLIYVMKLPKRELPEI